MRLVDLFAPAVAIMSSMKYPKKLALATAVFFLPFVLFLYVGYEHIETESESIQKLQEGLVYQQNIRNFLEYIPLQRGMTTAVQEGEISYKVKIEENFIPIESAIKAIDAMSQPTPSIEAEWKVIKSDWRILRKDLWNRSSSENYRDHTLLVDKVILLMQHIGDDSYTSNDSDLSIYHLVQILSDHIPNLVQYTGQERAIGMRVILKESITLSEKKEALSLYANIRSNIDGLFHDSDIVCKRHSKMCRAIKPSILTVKAEVEKFSHLFTTHILNNDRWLINSDDYFQKTTHTIDTYFNAYDTISSALQSHLNERLIQLRQQMIIGWIIAFSVLVSLIYFTIGFYLSFMGVLNELTGAARLISRGDYIARIPILTDDEMADVSHAFNDMAKKIEQAFAFLESYKKAVDASNIVSITDIHGNITYVNDQFCLITGYSREELIGKNHCIFKDPLASEELYHTLWQTILDKKIWSGTLKNIKKDHTPYYADSTITPILDEVGDIVEFVATRHDITQLITQKEQLIHQLYTDPLTQLPNRAKLLEDLALLDEPVLILINIDRFGEINDFYGTLVGDEVLKGMRERIASSKIPEGFHLYRIYADEFALLCEKKCFYTHPYEEVITSLHTHIESSPFYVNNAAVIIKATIGAVIDPTRVVNEHTAASHLLTDADMALRHAKRYDKEFIILQDIGVIRQEIARNIEYISKIREAIAQDRIIPFFQGIIDNKSIDSTYNKLLPVSPTKYECLIRLIESDGQIVAPLFFLDVAKKAKLYPQLTRIMIDKTFANFQDNGYEFSINLSVEDILDSQTVEFILDKLKIRSVAERVIFEILESEGFENFGEVQLFIGKVKQLGGRIAIDDFGSGYSNFAYILHLHVDFIKIDASLIKNIDKDDNSRIIVETIVAFAKKLKIKTVAEFVYSKEVFEIVQELGIDYSQGYYFHQPTQFL